MRIVGQHNAHPHVVALVRHFIHDAPEHIRPRRRIADVDVLGPHPDRYLLAALDDALRAPRTTLIHVRTDREENVAVHRRVWESVRAAA